MNMRAVSFHNNNGHQNLNYIKAQEEQDEEEKRKRMKKQSKR